MSNKTIHELDSLSDIAQNDEMLIYDVSAGADNPTKKTTAGNLLNFIKDKTKDVYSTDEVKTNKVWIDGKPIYRRTIVYTNQVVQANSDLIINHGIANIDHIIKADILPHYSLGEETVMLQWNLITNKWVTATKLQLHNEYSADITFISLEFFIEYTKTTD